VGASYACGALTNLVKKEILIDVTECYLEPMDNHLGRFGQPKDILATVCIDVATGQGSRVLMILPMGIAAMLSDLMMGTQNPPGRMLTEEDKEVLTEMGDVCIREYLVPISKFLKISPMPSAPVVHVQYVGASAAKANSVLGLNAPYEIRIMTDYVDRAKKYHGTIIFLPDEQTQDLAFKKFGVDTEAQSAMYAKFGV
jgi:chemotaxis protein CheY-P-specific phosphatase CheC